jgi:hypothetical protein
MRRALRQVICQVRLKVVMLVFRGYDRPIAASVSF